MQTPSPFRRAVPSALAVLCLSVSSAACSKASTPGADSAPAPTKLDQVQSAYGSSKGPPDGATPKDGGNLVFGIEAEPEGLDPTRYAFASSGHMVASAVFDPLATLDAKGEPVPYLASAIEHNADHTTWTLTIPAGIEFHDGTKLDAAVVVDNLEAYRSSLITAQSMGTVSSVSAPDPTHVEIRLKQPMVAFASALATQIGYVVAPAMLTDATLVDHPIGTGPFVIQSHTKDDSWKFKRNGKYWRKGLPHLDAIDYRPTPDNEKRLNMLRAGDLDLINVRSPKEILDLRASTMKVVENGEGEEEYLLLNTSAPPFDNKDARLAVAYALDAERWRKDLLLGVDPPANSPFAPGQLGYLEDNGYPAFDLAKAKEHVKKYTDATGKPLDFTWHTQADITVQAESQLLTDMFAEAGMKVSVTALAQINLIAVIATGNYQMGRFRLFSAANPDVDALTFWSSASILPSPQVSLNFPRFGSAKIDEAITTAAASTDPKVRDEAYKVVNRELAAEVPYVWLGRAVWILAANARVNGIYAAANGTIETIGPKTWISELWIA